MTYSTDAILKLDGYLEPFIPAITSRHAQFQEWKKSIERSEGGLEPFSKGYNKFGFNVRDDGTVVYREWAPNAKEAVLIGDFSEQPSSISSYLR
jgi:1,4-alpha-glucan branching enzyme